jgi:hypothetical protein
LVVQAPTLENLMRAAGIFRHLTPIKLLALAAIKERDRA